MNQETVRADPGGGDGKVHRLTSPLVIEASNRSVRLDFREAVSRRELLAFLTWRDIKVRYKQTVLGIGWAVLQPLTTMVVFTIFFNRVAKISSGDVPYPVFVLAGIVVWGFFAAALSSGSMCLVANASMLTKVYFPRLLVPVSTSMSGVIDFMVGFILLLVVMAGYGMIPTAAAIVVVPFVIVITFVAALGAGLVLGSLNVRYRDVRYIVPVMIQLWLLASPVAYSASSLDEPWQTLYGLNPMAGAIESFRWAMLDTPAPSVPMVALSTLTSLLFLGAGLYVFGHLQRRFADVI